MIMSDINGPHGRSSLLLASLTYSIDVLSPCTDKKLCCRREAT